MTKGQWNGTEKNSSDIQRLWPHSLKEFFSVPFHWPFVIYGWLAGGMFAVWGEMILYLFQIEKKARAVEELPTHTAAAG